MQVKNLKDLMQRFSNEDTCRAMLVQQRWNGTPVCPYCNSTKSYVIEGGKRFKCGERTCYKKYSVTVGTVFHATNIPLTTWFPAMYLISAHKKGISSVQLAKDLGVTQKTAWFMMHRIRESLKEKNSQLLTGIVEIDETYMSRKFASHYQALPPDEVERLTVHKKRTHGAVIGMKQRGGNVIVKAVSKVTVEDISNLVNENVDKKAKLMTDEANKYKKILRLYKRESVNHSLGEFVRGNVHTNGIENFWSIMKRGIYGIYHQISYKHLQRYCDEFSYRYNSKDLQDGNRFELSLQRLEGRLTYKQLVHGKGNQTSKENKA